MSSEMKTAEQLVREFDFYATNTLWTIIAIVVGEETITVDFDDPAKLSILKEAMEIGGMAIGMAKFVELENNSIHLDIRPLPEASGDVEVNRLYCRGLGEKLREFLISNGTKNVLVTGID